MTNLNDLIKQRNALDVKIEAAQKAEIDESTSTIGKTDKDGHFSNYSEYSKALRSWLVAYGIGGPVLFLTNEAVSQKLINNQNSKWIIFLFLSGVVLQVLLAFINKWAARHLYKGEIDQDHENTCIYRTWLCINNQSWIDFAFDLLSLCFFAIATGIVLNIFISISIV